MENFYRKNIQLLRLDQMTSAPWHWLPNEKCEKTKAFFKFLGKEYLTPEEFSDIINMRFHIELYEVPEAPIQTTFEIRSEYFFWKDTAGKRYAGLRQSQTPGSKYYNIKAFSNSLGNIVDKLFDRRPERKKREVYK